MASLVGQKLGKYEIKTRLGRGGMAEVYKAYQPGLERFVAVKVMTGHFAEMPEFVARFKREARSIAQLRHSNIVQVFDFDIEDNLYYMVMEYIQGGTLHQRLQRNGALSPQEAVNIMVPLTDALAYAHQHRMIHRDLKPANVMFTDVSGSHPVLTDFGIARILGETALTTSGFIGTPGYISPEVGRGEPLDERADVYSMGVMLYEMVTGRMPYYGDTPYAVIMKHIHEPLPSPRQFKATLPEALEDVIYKALAKRPNRRYQNARELKAALQALVTALPDAAPAAPVNAQRNAGLPLVSVPTPVLDVRTVLFPTQSEMVSVDSKPVTSTQTPPDNPSVRIQGGEQTGVLTSQTDSQSVAEQLTEPPRRKRRGALLLLAAAFMSFTAIGLVMWQGGGIPGGVEQSTDEALPAEVSAEVEESPTPPRTPSVTRTDTPTEVSSTPTRGTPTGTLSPAPSRVRPSATLEASDTLTPSPTRPTSTPTPIPPTNTPVPPTNPPPPPATHPPAMPTSVPPTDVPTSPPSNPVDEVGDTVDTVGDTAGGAVCTLLCPP